MCRITGIVDKGSTRLHADSFSMRDSMSHGGPDSAGMYYDEQAALSLGHRRLSIIDLCETGSQPMFSEDKALTLIFNGEVYNYLELKAELVRAGFNFRSSSDTEVVLKAYQYWGTDCFAKFRGMFALAIHDKPNARLVLARDHAGIKPLYYYCDGRSLYFASEIRAFKTLNNKWEENPEWKVFFLTYGYLPNAVTTLKGVKPLEKGSFMVVDTKTLQSRQEFFFKDSYTEEITDPGEARELIHDALQKAVQRHLIADAPLGIFLSGGIDSSLITLLAKPFKEELHTLSIIFDDKNYSEKKYQDLIVEKVGSKHRSFLLDKKLFLDALPDILLAMDQPSADGINSYFISKFAKEAGLKAVLSGLGADEFFGGYSSFKRGDMVRKLRLIPKPLLEITNYLSQNKYKKISFLKSDNAIGEYLFNRGYFTDLEIAGLLDMDQKEVRQILLATQLPEFLQELDKGNRASYFESNLYMEHQLLRDTDVMSMWHSIEVRVPFLDYDLIKTVQRISSKLKFDHEQSKFLLIDSFKNILPEEIWNRKKQGFVFPFETWMKENLDSFSGINQKAGLDKKFKAGKLTWSRYWTYLLSQSFKA
jgi:asparagine synthase (glutamine-hydrolysing)